jgi:hypothetical protein
MLSKRSRPLHSQSFEVYNRCNNSVTPFDDKYVYTSAAYAALFVARPDNHNGETVVPNSVPS